MFNDPSRSFIIAFLLLFIQEKMKSAISSLQEKREAFDKMKKNCEETVTHIQVQYPVVTWLFQFCLQAWYVKFIHYLAKVFIPLELIHMISRGLVSVTPDLESL